MDETAHVYEFKRVEGMFRIVEEDLDNLRHHIVNELDRLQSRISVLERQLREANGRNQLGNR